MFTIQKHVLQLADKQVIMLPMYAKFLSVQMRKGKICLWVLVNSQQPYENIEIYIVCTGQPTQFMPSAAEHQYIGTVEDYSGLDWHVFSK